MNYHNITNCDMLNGKGLRVVLWLAHCDFNCKGCQNPQTHDKDSGILFDENAREELISYLSKDYIQGLTLSGGDPLSTINRVESLKLAKDIKEMFPNKDIWAYSGYKWEDVCNLENIQYLDVLVDGNYIEELNFPSPKWCGSNNQRLVDVKKTLKIGEVSQINI